MKPFRRIAGVALLVTAVGALTALPVRAQTPPTTSTTSPPVTTHEVEVDDNVFRPKRLRVTVGDKVTWIWEGSARHDVRVRKGPQKFKSKLKSDGKFTRTIREPGKYTIHCSIHPGMEMKLTAKPAPPAPTTSAPPAP